MTLSACTCNAAHGVLFDFNEVVTRSQKRKVPAELTNRALRYFQLRGRAGYLSKIKDRIDHGQEDMSCLRFLLRAFLDISRAEPRLSNFDNYWGAYLVVGSELWSVAQREKEYLPDFRTLSDRINKALTGKDKASLIGLCNIIEGLEQGLGVESQTHKEWDKAKKILGENIIDQVFKRFCGSILTEKDWHRKREFLNTARNLVRLWCHLERLYMTMMRSTDGESGLDKRAVFKLLKAEVCDQKRQTQEIFDALQKAPISDAYACVKGSFGDSCFELEKVLEGLKQKGFEL